jgi:hypothetical protein
MRSIKLHKEELKAILETLRLFPDVDAPVSITQQEVGVTGSVYRLEILFDTTVNGIPGVFKVDMADTYLEHSKLTTPT